MEVLVVVAGLALINYNWGCYPCVTTSCKSYDKCIPYNDETKHLLGTSEEAPEYYRYWED